MIYTGGQIHYLTSIFESTVPNPIKFSFLKPIPFTQAAVEFQAWGILRSRDSRDLNVQIDRLCLRASQLRDVARADWSNGRQTREWVSR